MNYLRLWSEKLTPKKIFIAFLLGILVLSLPLIIIELKKQQEIRSRAAEEPVSFSFLPDTTTKTVGETFDAQLSLNAAGNQVSAIDLTFNFDNSVLEMINFTPTDAFNTQLKNAPNNNNGSLVYTAGDTAGKPVVGSVILGTIRFNAKSPGISTINLQKAKVTPSGKSGLLPTNTTIVASYTIAQSGVSPTDTQTPTVTLTSTPPTQQPTATPTDAPTPTFAPIPTLIPGGSRISLDIALSGVGLGIGSNPNPRTKQKRATICAYLATTDTSDDNNCNKGKKAEGFIQFNEVSKKFDTATFDLGIVQEGDYEIYIKVDRYLRKRIPGTKHLSPNTTSPLLQTQLKNGDITMDNTIDIQDYNAYVSCFREKFNTPSCLYKETVDLNDDGKSDTTTDFSDYRIFFQNIASREGD